MRIWLAELQQSESIQLVLVVRIFKSRSSSATGGTVVGPLIFSSSGASIGGAICHCSWRGIAVGFGCAHDSNV